MTADGPRHDKDDRAPNAGHVAALAAALAVGAFLVALGVFGAVHNRLTLRELIAGAVAVLVGAVAALWLRRESRQHGGGPE